MLVPKERQAFDMAPPLTQYHETPVTRRDCWINAFRSIHPRIPGEILVVEADSWLGTTDEWYLPVYDFLSDKCSREINWETVEHPEFMTGECKRTEYMIYAACPGAEEDHNCVMQRSELKGGERVNG